jgi:archaemetzincin
MLISVAVIPSFSRACPWIAACLLACSCKPKPAPVVVDTLNRPGEEGSVAGDAPLTVERIEALGDALEPLHEKMGPVLPGDWLSVHEEPGQSFAQYRASDPVVPGERYRAITILPLGTFSPGQERIVELAAGFMGKWFGVPVKIQQAMDLDVVPPRARRPHPYKNAEQILTGFVLDEVLEPRISEDALGYIAFTTSDLWAGPGWNFVFGQASLKRRVGVWSMFRYGNPDQGKEEFRRVLWRTLGTGTHEMGHMIGITHCTAWRCGMNGSNSLDESDRQPLQLCPECLKKLLWATKVDPEERFEALRDFCAEHGLEAEEEYYEGALEALRSPGSS